MNRHRAWRSAGSPALAAAPWVVIFSGIVALAVLLAVTLWSGLNRDSSRSGTAGTNNVADQFPPPMPAVSLSPGALSSALAPGYPATAYPPGYPGSSPGSSPGPPPGGSSTAFSPAPGQGSDAPARTGTISPTTPAPAATTTSARTATVDAFAVQQAESFSARSGGTVVACDEGGKAVTALGNGDWLRYDNVDFGTTRAVDFLARAASGVTGGGSGLIQIRLDSPSATPIGDFALDNTGGWQSWRSVPGNVSAPTGTHTLYLTFQSAQPADYAALNWFTFRT
ncbi:carbohydrate-binding protein [Actinoplanes sichuanensis]|uniref:Carbohydrate-binding protein n=1 Tax=Actinoplanes sichuanensis TaxID=512349 RepID=A0ABW4AN74_9ACTN